MARAWSMQVSLKTWQQSAASDWQPMHRFCSCAERRCDRHVCEDEQIGLVRKIRAHIRDFNLLAPLGFAGGVLNERCIAGGTKLIQHFFVGSAHALACIFITLTRFLKQKCRLKLLLKSMRIKTPFEDPRSQGRGQCTSNRERTKPVNQYVNNFEFKIPDSSN
jgi:hypothetical protein